MIPLNLPEFKYNNDAEALYGKDRFAQADDGLFVELPTYRWHERYGETAVFIEYYELHGTESVAIDTRFRVKSSFQCTGIHDDKYDGIKHEFACEVGLISCRIESLQCGLLVQFDTSGSPRSYTDSPDYTEKIQPGDIVRVISHVWLPQHYDDCNAPKELDFHIKDLQIEGEAYFYRKRNNYWGKLPKDFFGLSP